MADFDVIDDTVPQLAYRPTRNYARLSVDELIADLQAIDEDTYTDAACAKMTYNDLVYAIVALS